MKPANLKVTSDGVLKVLDFGLAKAAVGEGTLIGPSQLPTVMETRQDRALVVGTPAYMSPEQARGLPVDKRTDIWAFGCVVYETLTGRTAFAGDTVSDAIARILEREPDWAALPASTPAHIRTLLRRCLEKDATRRLQDIGDARLELVLETERAQPSIAVLPFSNLSADKENEYFGDGLAEEIINALTQVAGLRVIARTSAFVFRDRPEDVRRIADVLGVTNILQGSVRKAGPRIRVTTQLISGVDGTQVWSSRYDRDMAEVFAVQDEIAQAVVDALRDRLELGGSRHVVQRQTADIDAYHQYVRGRHHFYSFEPADMDAGRALFEEAVAIDPTYAAPLVDLAHYYWVNTMTRRIASHDGAPKGSRAAETALAHDPGSGEALGFLGRFKALYEYRWMEALDDLEKALDMNPASGLTAQGHAAVLTALNRIADAVHQQEHALKADPFSPLNQYFMARSCVYAGDYDKAAEHAMKAIEIAPASWLAHGALGLVQLWSGSIPKAVRSLERAKSAAPVGFVTSGWLGCAYIQAGEIAKAKDVLQELEDATSPVPAAMIQAQLGNAPAAYDLLRAAVRQRDFQLYGVQLDATLDNLRSDPDYQDLLRSMNL